MEDGLYMYIQTWTKKYAQIKIGSDSLVFFQGPEVGTEILGPVIRRKIEF